MRAPALLRSLGAAADSRFERLPIRLKLAVAFAAVMVVLFGLLFLLLYTRFAAGLDAGITSSLETRAADLSDVARESDASLAADPSLPAVSGGFAQVLAPDGRVLASTPGHATRSLLTATQLATAQHRRVAVAGNGHVQLLASRPIAPSRNVLVVGVSTADRDSALDSLQRLLFVGGPIALLIACAAGYVVAAKALQPVERMRRRADRMFEFGLNERLPVPPARDEIQRLGQTLNDMLAKVQDVVERDRAFVAGASHELRTPLTILQLELDDTLGEDRPREELEAAIASAREEVRRLTALAEDLLVIAQGDQQRLMIAAERFEAREAMRVVAARYAHLVEAVGRKVVVESGPPIAVEADVARLDQALSNMVSNALRFGEGDVVMRASQQGDRVSFSVLDSGPGFPPEFLERAFERFSRANPARSRGGSGLGLSIVQAIARAHGGDAWAENRAGGGAHVWLTLPAKAVPGAVFGAPVARARGPSAANGGESAATKPAVDPGGQTGIV